MKFDALIEDLKKAKSYIHLEYYIFTEDKIGSKILDILEIKASEGVIVRIIVDDVGSWHLKHKFYKKVREAAETKLNDGVGGRPTYR